MVSRTRLIHKEWRPLYLTWSGSGFLGPLLPVGSWGAWSWPWCPAHLQSGASRHVTSQHVAVTCRKRSSFCVTAFKSLYLWTYNVKWDSNTMYKIKLRKQQLTTHRIVYEPWPQQKFRKNKYVRCVECSKHNWNKLHPTVILCARDLATQMHHPQFAAK